MQAHATASAWDVTSLVACFHLLTCAFHAAFASAVESSSREFAVSCVQWYPFDTGMFISGSMDGRVSLFDTNTFSIAHQFRLNAIVHAATLSSVATAHALIASQCNSACSQAAQHSLSLLAHRLRSVSSPSCLRLCRVFAQPLLPTATFVCWI